MVFVDMFHKANEKVKEHKCVQVYERRMKQYMEKLGLTAATRGEPSADDGARVLGEMNQLNQRYKRLITELHQRLTHIKKVYDDVGIYFPVSSCISSYTAAAAAAAALASLAYSDF